MKKQTIAGRKPSTMKAIERTRNDAKPTTPSPSPVPTQQSAVPNPPVQVGRKDDSGKARFDLIPAGVLVFLQGYLEGSVNSPTDKNISNATCSLASFREFSSDFAPSSRASRLVPAVRALFAMLAPGSSSSMPGEAMAALVRVLEFGAFRAGKDGTGYGENNWQGVDNAIVRYYAAAMRHLNKIALGEKLNPESGEPHAAHALANVVFLISLTLKGVK